MVYVLAKAILVFAPLRQFRHLQEASGKAFAAAVPGKAIIIRSGSAEAREEAACSTVAEGSLQQKQPAPVCGRFHAHAHVGHCAPRRFSLTVA